MQPGAGAQVRGRGRAADAAGRAQRVRGGLGGAVV